MKLFHTKNIQCFVFGPNSRGRMQGIGYEFRVRYPFIFSGNIFLPWQWIDPRKWKRNNKYRPTWTHYKLILFAVPRRDLRRGRGTMTWEYNHWKTSPGATRERVTLKAGLRFKIMLGGPRPEGMSLIEAIDEDPYDDPIENED